MKVAAAAAAAAAFLLHSHSLPPMPSPSPSPSPISSSSTGQHQHPVNLFSPPVIAMVVVVAAAFIVVTYCRLISRRLINPMLRRRPYSSTSSSSMNVDVVLELEESPSNSSSALPSHSYGLDDAAIKTLPVSVYRPSSPKEEYCSVCIVEFGGQEYVRTLPVCSHAFHVNCIDVWLKSHANCPLCRASIFLTDLEDDYDDDDQHLPTSASDRFQYFTVLKRSYSFGFERRSATTTTEEETASPWRLGGLWSKRVIMSSSPLLFRSKARVMSSLSRSSYYYYMRSRGMMMKRRSLGEESRRMASPMLLAGSSRMRCGDPEALVSPERLNRS